MKSSLLAAGVIGLTALAAAQQPAAHDVRTLPPSAPVPVDSAITIGSLPNGLRYYVRINSKPEKRVELRLVVKAGSILEDDDQRGLAHVVEHMAFDGTARFPGQSIRGFLSSLGENIGSDANASTGVDETIYRLRVPTDRPGALDRGLQLLADWAQNVSFDPKEIDRERSVVTEEWRQRLSAATRVRELEQPVLFKNSRYVNRAPIGTVESLRDFQPARLVQFYRDWYRPDLMAVVVVGDLDAAATAARIEAEFRAIAPPASPRPRPFYPVPDHDGTAYAIVSDKETATTSAGIQRLLPIRDQSTIGAYRDKIVDRLFVSLLSSRFGEVARQADPPFVIAAVARASITHTRDAASLSVLVKDNGIGQGLGAGLAEIRRVTQYGFAASEVERQKQTLLRGYERIAAEAGSRESASRADEYVRNFLTGETLPRAEDEYTMVQRFLPEIGPAEVAKLASLWFADGNRVVLVSLPDRPGVIVPDQAQLATILKNAAESPVQPYVDRVTTQPLMVAPMPGSIDRTEVQAEIRVAEWTLSNGAKVVLKPTTFKDDEILFRAVRSGGTSLASDEDYPAAASIPLVIGAAGVGSFNAQELQKQLAGRLASVRPTFTELSEGLTGSASTRDLETLFQLIHLRFTAPRADPAVFSASKAMTATIMGNQDASPDAVFNAAVAAALTQDHPRRRPEMSASVQQWDLNKSLAFYRARFGDASGFTFVFVGSFDVDAMKPLVEQYLASLPATHQKESWRDLHIRPPDGIVNKTIHKGIEPKAQVAIVFQGPLEYDLAHRAALRALLPVLSGRLNTIRQELGATYSISAVEGVQKVPVPQYSIRIQWTCAPERVEEITQRVFDQVATVRAMSINMTTLIALLHRPFETSSKTNQFWINELSRAYEFGDDPTDAWQMERAFDQLQMMDFNRAARTYLNPDHSVRVTMLPER